MYNGLSYNLEPSTNFITWMRIKEEMITVRNGIDKITYKILVGKLEGIDSLGEIEVDA